MLLRRQYQGKLNWKQLCIELPHSRSKQLQDRIKTDYELKGIQQQFFSHKIPISVLIHNIRHFEWFLSYRLRFKSLKSLWKTIPETFADTTEKCKPLYHLGNMVYNQEPNFEYRTPFRIYQHQFPSSFLLYEMVYTRSSTTYFNSLLLITKSQSAKELFDDNEKETTPGFGWFRFITGKLPSQI